MLNRIALMSMSFPTYERNFLFQEEILAKILPIQGLQSFKENFVDTMGTPRYLKGIVPSSN